MNIEEMYHMGSSNTPYHHIAVNGCCFSRIAQLMRSRCGPALAPAAL